MIHTRIEYYYNNLRKYEKHRWIMIITNKTSYKQLLKRVGFRSSNLYRTLSVMKPNFQYSDLRVSLIVSTRIYKIQLQRSSSIELIETAVQTLSLCPFFICAAGDKLPSDYRR